MMTRIGGLLRQHGAHLHRRSVRAQQQPRAVRLRIEEERVVHRPRRMVFRKIQLGEIVIVGLDVGTFGDGESHIGENRGELVDDLRDRMDAADLERRFAHRQRDVDALAIEPLGQRHILECVAACAERGVDAILEPVDERTLRLAFIRRQRAERFQERGDRAVLAERRHPHGFQRSFVAGGRDRGEGVLFKLRNVGHRCWSRRSIGMNGKSVSDGRPPAWVSMPCTWPRWWVW